MKKEQFFNDVKTVFGLVQKREDKINEMLNYEKHPQVKEYLVEFVKSCGLDVNKKNLSVFAERLVTMKPDGLTQLLDELKYSEEEAEEILMKAYSWVSNYYQASHLQFLEKVRAEGLLTEFYRTLLFGWHRTGCYVTELNKVWKRKLVYGINKTLKERYGNLESVTGFLEAENLYDKGHEGEKADRCYSILVSKDGELESQTYAVAFKSEVLDITNSLRILHSDLEKLEDEVLNQKTPVLNYIQALIDAFECEDPNSCVRKWYEVDIAWMDVKGPIQPAHPLEYYEDAYRNAVACDWDIRIQDLSLPKNKIGKTVRNLFEKLTDELELSRDSDTYKNTLKSLSQVQLCIGAPLTYYGDFFNGHYSAQIVPNDELATKQSGKKIFAFPKRILKFSRSKKIKELSIKVWGEENVKRGLSFLMNEDEKFFEVYDISTIGHEFGHALFKSMSTEAEMNKSGCFKLVEEWKATNGGKFAYFEEGDEKIIKEAVKDYLGRSVGLIAWMEETDKNPYYCEGLINLKLLFDSGILSFDGKSVVEDTSFEKIEKLKVLIEDTFKDLAKEYIQMNDAKHFLNKFAEEVVLDEKKKTFAFLPVDPKLREFVLWYYDLFKKYGNVEYEGINKEDYIIKK